MGKAVSIVQADYQGTGMTFDEGAWFNATSAAAFFGKQVKNWLKTKETKEYLKALAKHLNTTDQSHLNSSNRSYLNTSRTGNKEGESRFIKTRRGKNGGTWFHPRLAVPFARWCNPDFGVWCDIQIAQILEGKHPHFDWKKVRHEATASFKVVMESVKLEREYQGKAVEKYHYMNETRLINWCLAGEFKSLDRDALTTEELDLMARLEVRAAALLGRGMSYQERKAALKLFVDDWKIERIRKLDKAA